MSQQKRGSKVWSVVHKLLQSDRKWKVRACIIATLLGLNIGTFLQPYVLNGFRTVEALPAKISAGDVPAAQAVQTPPRTPLQPLDLPAGGK